MAAMWISVAAGVAISWAVQRFVAAQISKGDPRHRDPTDEQRRRCYAETRRVMIALETLRPGTVETALFLLSEAKESAERARIASDSLVAKATTLVGLAAGASGALGIFASSHDGSSFAVTPLAVAAMGCLLSTICCALYLLRARLYDSVDIGAFISPSMVREDNRCGIALALALAHCKTARQLRHDMRHEAVALFGACLALTSAAALILANAIAYSQNGLVKSFRTPPGATSVLRSPAACSTLSPILNRARPPGPGVPP